MNSMGEVGDVLIEAQIVPERELRKRTLESLKEDIAVCWGLPYEEVKINKREEISIMVRGRIILKHGVEEDFDRCLKKLIGTYGNMSGEIKIYDITEPTYYFNLEDYEGGLDTWMSRDLR